jgi:mycothiol synthase
VEFLVEHPEDRPSVVHLTFSTDESRSTVEDALALAQNVPGAEVWIHGSTDDRADVMQRAGYRSNRTLLQMRCALPQQRTDLETRSFSEANIDEFVMVNNRAFAWHPEQSGLTPDAVRADMASNWFDPEGFRLHFQDGRLAGFCWTKVHREPEPLGEIYVIAVDPDFHGKGLGTALTLAGLQWLSDAGQTTGMLYVESDNAAAVATYRKIGFDVEREDTLWQVASGDSHV